MPDLNEQENQKGNEKKNDKIIDRLETAKNITSTKKEKNVSKNEKITTSKSKHRKAVIIRKNQSTVSRSKRAKIRMMIRRQQQAKKGNASITSSPIKRSKNLKHKEMIQSQNTRKKRLFRNLNVSTREERKNQQKIYLKKSEKYQKTINRNSKLSTEVKKVNTQKIQQKKAIKARALINNKKQIDGRVLVKKQKPTVQSVRQKQDRKQQLILKKKKKTDTQHIIAKKETKQQTAKKQYQETGKKKQDKEKLQGTSQRKKNLFSNRRHLRNQQYAQKYVRASGKKQIYKKRNKKQKVNDQLKKKVSPKRGAKNYFKEMVIDKFGRDSEGNLNIIGMILMLVLLVPILMNLIIIIALLSVVIAIIAVIMAIWAFIVSLFVVKTESMMITEAYEYVTWLDVSKNKEAYERYNQLVDNPEYDEVYFEVNNIASDPEKFSVVSNGDNYIYYLNAKYEDYDIEERAVNVYIKRLAKNTGIELPISKVAHVQFKDTPHPSSELPIKINRVKHEIHAIHDMTYSYETVIEKDKEIETTVVTIDEETGEEKTETKVEIKDIATVKIEVQTLNEMLDSKPEVEIYGFKNGFLEEESNYALVGTVEAFDEAEVDKYYPIMELDRFESKIFMDNPLGKNTYSPVVENYGYRGRDEDKLNIEIMLDAEPGSPVYATTDEEVDGINRTYGAQDRDGKMVETRSIKTDTGDYYAFYINVDPVVRNGQDLKAKDLIGYTRSTFGGNLLIAMEEFRALHSNADIYPAIFIDNLVFASDTNLAYSNNSGGLRGELFNPPEKVIQWRSKVYEEAIKNNIGSYVNTILSIIWVETGGDSERFSDIMGINKAYSVGGTVHSPTESIEKGVKYFAKLLKKTQANQLGEKASLQAYSYGEAYLDDLIRIRGRYSFDHSRLYAKEKSQGKTISYNSTPTLDRGYNWRYTFGNMFYPQLVTYNISADIGKLVGIAKKELGTPNGDKYWQWGGFDKRIEWPAIFVSWVASQAGYLDQGRVLNTPSPLSMMKWYQDNRKFQAPTVGYIPQSGDLIFFDWKGKKTGKDHVGIVEYSGGNIVQVIEGNSNNLVRRRTYALDNIAISGYGIP